MGSDRDDPRIDWAAREVGRAYFGARSVVNAVVALSSARALNLVLLILVAYLLSHKSSEQQECAITLSSTGVFERPSKPRVPQTRNAFKQRTTSAASLQDVNDKLFDAELLRGWQCKLKCTKVPNVCLDGGEYVLHNRTIEEARQFKETQMRFVTDLQYNYPGLVHEYLESNRFFKVRAKANSFLDKYGRNEAEFSEMAPFVLAFRWWGGYADVVVAMSGLHCAQEAKLWPKSAQLVVDAQGFHLQRFYDDVLGAFSTHHVAELHDFSSRNNQHDPKCFKQLQVCHSESLFGSDVLKVGDAIIAHYRLPSPQPDRATDSTLTLSIIHRNDNKRRLGGGRGIRNLDDVMGNCTAHSSKMNIVCEQLDFIKMGNVNGWKALRSTDILIGTHGAGIVNAIFLPHTSSLVEIFPPMAAVWMQDYWRKIFDPVLAYFAVKLPADHPRFPARGFENSAALSDSRYWDIELSWADFLGGIIEKACAETRSRLKTLRQETSSRRRL